MKTLQSVLIRWNRLPLLMVLVVAASAGLAGCGGTEAEKTAPQTEYPAVNKAADDAQLNFMKEQAAKKK